MKRVSISLVLPTNTKDCLCYLFCKTSLCELIKIRKRVDLSCAIIGQTNFNFIQNQVKSHLQGAGIKVRIKMVPQESIARMGHLRQLGCILFPRSDYFLLVDDNLELKEYSAASYMRAIDFMEQNPKCGMVLCEGPLGSAKHGNDIILTRTKWVQLGRGIIVRNFLGTGQIFPKAITTAIGGFEETVCAAFVNFNGLFVAKQFRNPTVHHVQSKLKHGVQFGIHSIEVIEKNAKKLINQLFPKSFRMNELFLKTDLKINKVRTEVSKLKRTKHNGSAALPIRKNGRLFKLVDKNPRRLNTHGFRSWSVLRDGMTYQEAIANGSRNKDIRHDINLGRLRCE